MIKTIFGENGSGKTKKCEDLAKGGDVVIFLNRMDNESAYKNLASQLSDITEDSDAVFTTELTKKTSKPFLKEADLPLINSFIGSFGIKITQSGELKNVVLKKGANKFSL